jgi:hypothetical protein
MPTPNMNLTKPTVGGSSGIWGTDLNGDLDLIDAHDHSTGKGPKVATAGLDINADLPFAGFAATGLKAIDLNAVAPLTSGYLLSLFVSSSDNELYWRTSGGVNVKLTSGTSLNAALLGGFTGDYASSGAQADYQSSTKIFNFVQSAPANNHRARMDVGDLRLFEVAAAITNAVKLKSPGTLAASYDWIFPTALPASTKLLQVTSAGQLQYTGASTHDGNLTVSGTITVTGAATLQSTLGVTGLITATAGLTAAANQHVTVSGTGKFKRGSGKYKIPSTSGLATNGTPTPQPYGWAPAATTDIIYVPLPVVVGERILSAALGCVSASGAGRLTMAVVRNTRGTESSLGSASTATAGVETVTVSGLTETAADVGDCYFAKITFSTSIAGTEVYELRLETDVP